MKIQTKKDYMYFLKADRIALGKQKISPFLKRIFFRDEIWIFQKRLRKTEYLFNSKNGIHWKFAKLLSSYLFKKQSEKLGLTIPLNSFGPGLSIAHVGPIVVNENARIGANCRIHICVNIGTATGFRDKAPQIGDNCYIGPGAKIYGDIVIGNNVAIGANSVVNKSFLDENIVVGGVPARILKEIDIKNTHLLATELIEMKIPERELIGKAAREINIKYFHKP